MKHENGHRLRRNALLSFFLLAFGLAALARAEEKFQEYTDRIPDTLVTFDMVPIPAGEFTFKLNEKSEPQRVKIKRFWMGKAEVRWNEFDIWRFGLDLPNDRQRIAEIEAKTRPSYAYENPDSGYGHNGFPAINITFHSAQMYCKWLSQKTGRKYRLPTAEEWEHAARGGEAEIGEPEHVRKFAWCDEDRAAREGTRAVEKKLPNGYGLHDMLGNAAEWVVTNQTPPIAAGGSFRTPARRLWSAYREAQTRSWTLRDIEEPHGTWWLSDGDFVGFRVVREE